MSQMSDREFTKIKSREIVRQFCWLMIPTTWTAFAVLRPTPTWVIMLSVTILTAWAFLIGMNVALIVGTTRKDLDQRRKNHK